MATLTVYAGSEDGYLVGSGSYSTARANLTYISGNTDRLRFGQYYDGSYHLNESFVRFSLAGLPTGCTIESVEFSAYGYVETLNDLDISMQLRVYAKDWGPTLAGADHVDGSSLGTLTKLAYKNVVKNDANWVGAYRAFTSYAAFVTYITGRRDSGTESYAGKYAEFLLAYNWLEDGHQRTGYNQCDCYSGNNATQTRRPRLVITYSEGDSSTNVVGAEDIALTMEEVLVDATDWRVSTNTLGNLFYEVSYPSVTITTTNEQIIYVGTMAAELDSMGAKLPGMGSNDIDGFLVYVHEGSSNALPYVFGTEPGKEQIHMLPADVRSHRLTGLPVDKQYHFMVRAYRIVDTDIDADGVILSPEAQFPGSGYALSIDNVPKYSGPFKPIITEDVPSDWVGLFGNAEKFGYVENNVWKTYMDNQGHWYMIGPGDNSVSWDGSKFSVIIDDVNGGMVIKGGSISSWDKDSYDSPYSGFWLGEDEGEYKFVIGDEDNYLRWTGSELEILGNLRAGSSFVSMNESTIIDADGISIIATGGGAGTEESLDFFFITDMVGALYATDDNGNKRLKIETIDGLLLTAHDHIGAGVEPEVRFLQDLTENYSGAVLHLGEKVGLRFHSHSSVADISSRNTIFLVGTTLYFRDSSGTDHALNS